MLDKNNMKVTIEGKEFEIDFEKAKELGVLKEQRPAITQFEVGDTYRLNSGNFVVIVNAGWCFSVDLFRYSFIGLGNKLENYSPFGKEGGTKEQILERLNVYKESRGAVFVKNINEDFKKLLKSL